MSHENPYISRDVDIDAYVLQKDTAMNPYIVHMKTDLTFIPNQLRTTTQQKKKDVGTRKNLINAFDKKIETLFKNIKQISTECITEKDKVLKQLERIAVEETATSEDRFELQTFLQKIEAFTEQVERAHLNASIEEGTLKIENVQQNPAQVTAQRTQGGKGVKNPAQGIEQRPQRGRRARKNNKNLVIGSNPP
jgi:hypothetical protein